MTIEAKPLYMQEVMFWVFVAGILLYTDHWVSARISGCTYDPWMVLAHTAAFLFLYGCFTLWYFVPYVN